MNNKNKKRMNTKLLTMTSILWRDYCMDLCLKELDEFAEWMGSGNELKLWLVT